MACAAFSLGRVQGLSAFLDSLFWAGVSVPGPGLRRCFPPNRRQSGGLRDGSGGSTLRTRATQPSPVNFIEEPARTVSGLLGHESRPLTRRFHQATGFEQVGRWRYRMGTQSGLRNELQRATTCSAAAEIGADTGCPATNSSPDQPSAVVPRPPSSPLIGQSRWRESRWVRIGAVLLYIAVQPGIDTGSASAVVARSITKRVDSGTRGVLLRERNHRTRGRYSTGTSRPCRNRKHVGHRSLSFVHPAKLYIAGVGKRIIDREFSIIEELVIFTPYTSHQAIRASVRA